MSMIKKKQVSMDEWVVKRIHPFFVFFLLGNNILLVSSCRVMRMVVIASFVDFCLLGFRMCVVCRHAKKRRPQLLCCSHVKAGLSLLKIRNSFRNGREREREYDEDGTRGVKCS